MHHMNRIQQMRAVSRPSFVVCLTSFYGSISAFHKAHAILDKDLAMKNNILTVVAVLTLIFPFGMVAYELATKESLTTVGLFAAIIAVLFVTVVLAMVMSRPKQS